MSVKPNTDTEMKILAGHVHKSNSESNKQDVSKNIEKTEMTIDMEANTDTHTESTKPTANWPIFLLGQKGATFFQPTMQKITMIFGKVQEIICVDPKPLAVVVFTFTFLMTVMVVYGFKILERPE